MLDFLLGTLAVMGIILVIVALVSFAMLWVVCLKEDMQCSKYNGIIAPPPVPRKE